MNIDMNKKDLENIEETVFDVKSSDVNLENKVQTFDMNKIDNVINKVNKLFEELTDIFDK